MLKIRLMRIGTKKKPFYRVVAVDERAKRTGAYVELLGTYNPLTKPKDIKLKQDRIDYWVKQGAQLSDGYLRMTGKAPQRPPRKPKKSHSAEAPRDEEKKAESVKGEEKPVEEPKAEEPAAVSPQTSEEEKEETISAEEPKTEEIPQNEEKKPEEKKEEVVVEEPEKPKEESDEGSA